MLPALILFLLTYLLMLVLPHRPGALYQILGRFYALGMNLINGMETSSFGFLIAIIISVFVSVGSWWFLRFKHLI